MNEMIRYDVVECIISPDHPYLAKDKILYKIRDNKKGVVSMNAYTKKELADEVCKRKNESEK